MSKAEAVTSGQCRLPPTPEAIVHFSENGKLVTVGRDLHRGRGQRHISF